MNVLCDPLAGAAFPSCLSSIALGCEHPSSPATCVLQSLTVVHCNTYRMNSSRSEIETENKYCGRVACLLSSAVRQCGLEQSRGSWHWRVCSSLNSVCKCLLSPDQRVYEAKTLLFTIAIMLF